MSRIAMGYSNNINHPDINKRLNKGKKARRVFMIILIICVCIGLPGYALFNGDDLKVALIQAGFFSLVLVGMNMWYYFKNEHQSKPWDGHISFMGLEKVKVYVPSNDDDDPGKHVKVNHYMLHIKCPGRRKPRKIDFGVTGKGFNYYRQGERVVKHIGMPYPEKYNKTMDTHLICIGCGSIYPNNLDYCSGCGLILMK